MPEKTLVHALVEPKVAERIEKERDRESRSSFIRRILVRWHNKLPGVKQIEE